MEWMANRMGRIGRLLLVFVASASCLVFAVAESLAGQGFDSPASNPKAQVQVEELRRIFRNRWNDYDVELLPVVVEFLDSPYPEVVELAIDRVEAHPANPLAVPKLTALLTHENPECRMAAASALAFIGGVNDEAARSAVARVREARDELELHLFVLLLGQYRGTGVDNVGPLMELLREKPLRAGCPSRTAINMLAYWSRSRGRADRVRVGNFLAQVLTGELCLVKDLDRERQGMPGQSGGLGFVPGADRDEYRFAAAEALGDVGVATPPIVAALTKALGETSKVHQGGRLPVTMTIGDVPIVQQTLAGVAAEALGRLVPPPSEVLPKLRLLYQSPQLTEADCLCVAGAITLLDATSDELVPVIIKCAEGNPPAGFRRGLRKEQTRARPAEVNPILPSRRQDGATNHNRYVAAYLLGRLGPRAKPAVDVLLAGLDDNELPFRVYSAESLWRIARHPKAISALVHQDLLLTRHAACHAFAALEEFGSEAKAAAPGILRAFSDSDICVRRAAIDALYQISPAEAAQWSRRAGPDFDRTVTLAKCFRVDFDDDDLRRCQKGDQLRVVVLPGTGVTDSGLTVLANSPSIEYLNLSHTGITDRGLAHLRRLLGLKRLDLVSTKVTDAGLHHLRRFPRLERLDLAATHVTGAGFEQLKRLSRLVSLHLRNTNVNDEGLADLEELGELRYLDLRDTRVTQEGLDALRRALPDCTVVPLPPKTESGSGHLGWPGGFLPKQPPPPLP
jgi:hypothetical protein